MNTIAKGHKVVVLVEEVLEDVVVVSLKRGSKTLRGVLLDSSKRLLEAENQFGIQLVEAKKSPPEAVASGAPSPDADSPPQTTAARSDHSHYVHPTAEPPPPLAFRRRRWRKSIGNQRTRKRGPRNGSSISAAVAAVAAAAVSSSSSPHRGPSTARSPSAYDRHCKPLEHSGARSSLRTAMLGSLHMENEMKTKTTMETGSPMKANAIGATSVAALGPPQKFHNVSDEAIQLQGSLQQTRGPKSDSPSKAVVLPPKSQTWIKLQSGFDRSQKLTVSLSSPKTIPLSSIPLPTQPRPPPPPSAVTMAMATSEPEPQPAPSPKTTAMSTAAVEPVDTSRKVIVSIRSTSNAADILGKALLENKEVAMETEPPCSNTAPSAAEVDEVGDKEFKAQLELPAVTVTKDEDTEAMEVTEEPQQTTDSIPAVEATENVDSDMEVIDVEKLTAEVTTKLPDAIPEEASVADETKQRAESPSPVAPRRTSRKSKLPDRLPVDVAFEKALLLSKREYEKNPDWKSTEATTAAKETLIETTAKGTSIEATAKETSIETTTATKEVPQPGRSRRYDLYYAPRPTQSRMAARGATTSGPGFRLYEVVWAKMVDRPWWPARILSFEAGEGRSSSMCSASVKWFGRPTSCTSILPSTLLHSFVEGFSTYYLPAKKKKTYKRAIREALEAVGHDPEDPAALLAKNEKS